LEALYTAKFEVFFECFLNVVDGWSELLACELGDEAEAGKVRIAPIGGATGCRHGLWLNVDRNFLSP